MYGRLLVVLLVVGIGVVEDRERVAWWGCWCWLGLGWEVVLHGVRVERWIVDVVFVDELFVFVGRDLGVCW